MEKRLAKRPRRFWDSIHIASSAGWIGAALCRLTLNLLGTTTADPALRQAAQGIAHFLDTWVLVPLVLIALASGIVHAVRSKRAAGDLGGQSVGAPDGGQAPGRPSSYGHTGVVLAGAAEYGRGSCRSPAVHSCAPNRSNSSPPRVSTPV